MSTHLEAIYENGVFRPLQPIQLPERQRVTVTVDEDTDTEAAAIRAHFALDADQWQIFCDALDSPPKILPNLKKLLTESSLFDDERIEST